MGSVTVIIPTHRRPGTVLAAINSALRSPAHVAEIVVVDDGGHLNSRNLPRGVRYLSQPHRGASAARNLGIDSAAGEYVYFLDDDDELQPNAIPTLLGHARTDGCPEVVFGRWCTVDADGGVLRTPVTDERRASPHLLATRPVAPLSACLFAHSALTRIGGFDTAFDGLEDWELQLRLQHSGARFGFCDHQVARYLDNPGSQSKNWSLVLAAGHALLDANLHRLRIDDPDIRGRLHRYLLVETARRAARTGDTAQAYRLLRAALIDVGASDIDATTLSESLAHTSADLREEVQTSIFAQLCTPTC